MAFRKLDPTVPRCQIYERSGYRYLRSDLLAWLQVRGNAAETGPHLEALGGTEIKKAPPERGPTHQGFYPPHPLVPEVEDRLVLEDELLPLYGPPQVVLELQSP